MIVVVTCYAIHNLISCSEFECFDPAKRIPVLLDEPFAIYVNVRC